MRLSVISDIHGNLDALRAVLRRIRTRGTDVILVAGDLVAQGPWPVETLAEIRGLDGAVVIRGNTDRYLVDEAAVPLRSWPSSDAPERLRSLSWTRERLGDSALGFLASLPADAVVDGCLLVHASPQSDERGVFPATPQERFDTGAWTEVMACGHTHEPVHRRFGDRHLVNAGSVGWPLDGDPRPSYAVVEADPGSPRGWSVGLERVDYDRGRVVRDLEARGVPWRGRVAHFIETASARPLPGGPSRTRGSGRGSGR